MVKGKSSIRNEFTEINKLLEKMRRDIIRSIRLRKQWKKQR